MCISGGRERSRDCEHDDIFFSLTDTPLLLVRADVMNICICTLYEYVSLFLRILGGERTHRRSTQVCILKIPMSLPFLIHLT